MNIDFVASRKTFYGISLLLVLASLFFIIQKGINFSVEFRSGSILKIHFNESNVSKAEIEAILASSQFSEKFIQPVVVETSSTNMQGGAGKEFQITSGFIVDQANETEADHLLELELQKTWPSATALEFVNIGPTIGEDLKEAALVSVFLSILVVLVYLGVRFDKRNAVIAVVGVTQVVLIVLGVFALVQEEFSSATIAAFLALIGYALNDTIIIFDRIRENVKFMRREKIEVVINASINQTLGRTIKTSLTTFLPVLTMFYFGGSGLHSYSMVMLMGLIVGTYTSICQSATVLVDWESGPEVVEE